MRAITAGLLLAAALVLDGCANRGMVAPTRDAGGKDTTIGPSDGVSHSDGPGADAVCTPLSSDASIDHSTTACTSTYNFESSPQGAVLPSSNDASMDQAFKVLTTSGVQTYCGKGALAVTAEFSGTVGADVKGEVDLPLPIVDGGATFNLIGKTVTVHVSASAACDPSLQFVVQLRTQVSRDQPIITIEPVTGDWSTGSYTFTADGGVTGAAQATTLVLQAFDISGYQGTVYVDEIDIQ